MATCGTAAGWRCDGDACRWLRAPGLRAPCRCMGGRRSFLLTFAESCCRLCFQPYWLHVGKGSELGREHAPRLSGRVEMLGCAALAWSLASRRILRPWHRQLLCVPVCAGPGLTAFLNASASADAEHGHQPGGAGAVCRQGHVWWHFRAGAGHGCNVAAACSGTHGTAPGAFVRVGSSLW